MNEKQFELVTGLINDIWGMQFDQSKFRTWYRLLGGLNAERLLLSIDSLAKDPLIDPLSNTKETRYPPKIPQIIERYDELRYKEARMLRDKKIAESNRLLESQVKGQAKCSLCDNSGHVLYRREGYEYVCRCNCPRGNDLNKWSDKQLKKGLWKDPNTDKEVNLYVPNANDCLSPEEIEIIKAKNMASREIRETDSVDDLKDRIKNISLGNKASSPSNKVTEDKEYKKAFRNVYNFMNSVGEIDLGNTEMFETEFEKQMAKAVVAELQRQSASPGVIGNGR